MLIEFFIAKKWSEINPAGPHFEVVAGEQRHISPELAEFVLRTHQGKMIREVVDFRGMETRETTEAKVPKENV